MEGGRAFGTRRDRGYAIDIGFKQVTCEDSVKHRLSGAIIRKEFMALLDLGTSQSPSTSNGAR